MCFRYTVKTCKARIETNDVIAVAEYGDYDDSEKVSNVAAVALLVCKKTRNATTFTAVDVCKKRIQL